MSDRIVRIFADSTCDLSDETIEKYGITIVPLCIVLDDKSYYDRIEITPEDILKWADGNEILETRAGGVISSHCGPGTLGILYYMK